MPYVGNPLANAFSSREKQDLTGQSGTSFTLTHSVSHANDLSVYINHVRQEPTTAYSVNGTTLTTTGSVAGTDDFYIIYDELAVQSISHPTDQALTATSGTFTSGLVGTTGTFSGAVSGTTGTFSGAVTASDITLNTGSNSLLKFQDSTGTQVYQIKANVSDSADYGLLIEDGDNNDIAKFLDGGECLLTHNHNTKLQTTSSGVLITGALAATTLTGTLSTAAQPNITSVGTLTSATISGDLTVDSSTFKIDSSNNRLGVGTASPSFNAQISNASTSTSLTGLTDAQLVLENTGTATANQFTKIGFRFADGTYNGQAMIAGVRESATSRATALALYSAPSSDGDPDERIRITSTGDIGIGTNDPSFTSGSGMHLIDNYKIGFGNGGNSRPDFQLGYSSSTDRLQLACGYGADTGDIQFTTGGQQQFYMDGGGTALYFLDSSNSNYAVSGYELATYNGGTNYWYTQNSTHFGIKTGGSMGFFMKSDTRQVTLSNNSQNYPANTVTQLTIGYNLGGNKGGMFMPTYSYYDDIRFNVTNNDTNNGRQHDDIVFFRNGSRHGGIRIVGASGVSYSSISDYREKTDEKSIDDAIGTVKKLKPYNFKWKKSGIRQDGFFAHEVDEILDYVVSGDKDATKTYKGVVLNKDGNMIASEIKKEDFDKRLIDGEDEEASPKGETTYPEGSTWKETYEDIEPQQMDPAKLVPILTAALQEAIKRIEVLESK